MLPTDASNPGTSHARHTTSAGRGGSNAARTLGPELRAWVEDGASVGLPGVEYWTGFRNGVQLLTLSCVPESRRESLSEAKTLGMMETMLSLTTDDIASRPVAAGGRQQRRRRDLEIALADEFDDRIQALPRHDEFAGFLEYDRQRLRNVLRSIPALPHHGDSFRGLCNDPAFVAQFTLLASATMDVMGSPGFDSLEIGPLREALWRAEYSLRREQFGTVWERGDLPAAAADGETADSAQRRRHDLLLMQPALKSVDLVRYASGLEALLQLPARLRTKRQRQSPKFSSQRSR